MPRALARPPISRRAARSKPANSTLNKNKTPGTLQSAFKTHQEEQSFTKDSLVKLYRPISDLINGKAPDEKPLLDPALCGLLRASNTVIPHSGDVRVLQYHINAHGQPTMFHRHHFKYAVQYDPSGTKGGTANKNFCIEFYMNKTRIYHEREEMVNRVRRELSRLRVPGFEFRESPKAFCYDRKFNATNEDQLLREVRKSLFPLLNAVHPMFYRIMDAFNVPMTKERRRAVIAGRAKISVADRNSPHYGKNMEFRREIRAALRATIFRRDNNTCQHCERKCGVGELHADHVIPVARGGLTTAGNLQALCGPCNLRKGKRLEAEL